MEDKIIDDLKDIADRCFMRVIDKTIFFQREYNGARYCQWLNAETLEFNRRKGNLICPFADELATIGISGELHPLCNCYRQKK